MDHEVYIDRDNDIDYLSVISELQFQVEQLKFKIEQLNQTVNDRTDIIKMLEHTLTEDRNWETIENPEETQENTIIFTTPEIKANIVICHNLINHINKILIKKGLYRNHKLSFKVIQNINIK